MALADPDLSGSTAFITGTTRGIGKRLALALADHGCNIVSTGKTTDDDDSDLEGSIEQTAREVRDRGSEALALELDLRDEARVEAVVEEAIDHFGEVDIVINNASAIQLANIADLPANRFDLLTEVNVRGTHLVAHAFADHLAGLDEAWLLSNSPPVVTDRSPGKAPYAWSKLGMSFITLSLAEELASDDVGCNTFWPVTTIDTRATRYFGLGTEDDWRTPKIVSDAVLEILSRDPSACTGNSFYDEDLLREAGVTDFSPYNLTDSDPAPMSARLFDPEFEREV
ncbi:SDR family oxidoreductase [Halorubrum lacusprofundi]|jgi:citronellol/citronellal dehydrogenase|uniref:Short-chain dehydrogenase/reductase SDR n=1 Tax=Halorubrum lacusprofundi (strain ATCC 49239 / DSM 5036 / JCM 8891 / ACAM 34) TaxID=416348 RepID=B9LSI1_HALLT|nr:NAD(P)-dependent oxidoreductase [Halorubrum lacusprofundi]ACM57928.1 short-chain dehydrogenase/reductase SDR [Halorubrum lacusprofundi ATCC 49239]MCG1006918.1 NAD(P)-dependent oxidoreductase [Halorubrum lacusprofundi]